MYLWTDMWDRKNMVKVKVKVRGPSKPFYQLGYSQAPLAFLLIPGFQGCLELLVPSAAPLRKICRSHKDKVTNVCICALIQELFVEPRGWAYSREALLLPCEAHSAAGLGNSDEYE